jgi:hypothetical protein
LGKYKRENRVFLTKNKFRNDITYLITLSSNHFIPCLHCILSFISLGKKAEEIVVVGNISNKENIKRLTNIGVTYLDEDEIDYGIRMPKFSFQGEKLREQGWFKQQFIRLSADLFVKTPYALILDSEVFPFSNWDESRLFENKSQLPPPPPPRYLYWIPEKRKPEWDYKMYVASAMLLKDLPEFGEQVVEYANSDNFKRHINGFQLFSMKNLAYLWKRLEQDTDIEKNLDKIINRSPNLLFDDYDLYGIAVDYNFFDHHDKTILHNNLLGWYDNHSENEFNKFKKNAMWSMCQRYSNCNSSLETYRSYTKQIAKYLKCNLPKIKLEWRKQRMVNTELKFDSLEHEVLYESLIVNEKIEKIEYSKPNLYLTPFTKAIQLLEDLSTNTGDFPITYQKQRRHGRISIFIKRCIRKCLRWYINPIIERQNKYNAMVTIILKTMYKNIEELSSKTKKIPIDYNQELLFNQNSLAINYLEKGFSNPEDNLIWTDQDTAEINIPISLTKTDLKLTIRGRRLTPLQTVEIIVNNYSYGKIENQDSEFIIKADELLGQKNLNIRFIISKPYSPKELGISDDIRTLGFALIAIGLYEFDS